MQAYQENISAKVNGVLTPILGVKVTVTDDSTGHPATLFSDNGVTQITGDIVTDETGYFGFRAANGSYTVSFSSPQIRLAPRNIDLYDPLDAAPLTQAQAAAPSGASSVGYGQRTVANKLDESQSVTDKGIPADGTDQTSAILALFSAMPSYRGILRIPYGVKFNPATVYAAAPVGYVLQDESSINTGQPPSYQSKSRMEFCNDVSNDDSFRGVGSSHHAAFRLLNTGTSGTASGTNRYMSILRAVGRRWNKDLIDAMQWLTKLSPRGTLWRTSDVVNTRADYALNAANRWSASTVYAANAKMNTADGGVWKTTAGGTSSTTEPTGTGPTFTDGSVTWTYLGPWSLGSTVFYYDEDGYGGISGIAAGRWGAESANRKGLSLNVDDATGDVWLNDDQRSVKLIRLTTAGGLQFGGVRSLNRGSDLVGSTPSISNDYHRINNASATNITNFVLPTGQTSGRITVYALNGNNTIKWAGSNFSVLKGSADAVMPAGGVMTFFLDPNVSSGWIEESRNF